MKITKFNKKHFNEWSQVYRAYGQFYKKMMDETHLNAVWEWIQNDEKAFYALGAFAEETLVGIVHFRPFFHSLKGKESFFLDDLYVLENFRRQGIAKKLMQAVFNEAKKKQCALVRWITAPSNETAKKLYQQCGELTSWEVFDHVL